MHPTYRSPENRLSALGEKIFLDRYSLKDGKKKSLAVGDTVIVLADPQTSQREIGEIVSFQGNGKLQMQLRDGSCLESSVEHVDKPLELYVEDMMERVARGAAQVEEEGKRAEWEEKFRWLLQGWKFVPGGRILSACGTDQHLTFYNCFVVPSPSESRDGIICTLSHMAEIMSRGGGVGIFRHQPFQQGIQETVRRIALGLLCRRTEKLRSIFPASRPLRTDSPRTAYFFRRTQPFFLSAATIDSPLRKGLL